MVIAVGEPSALWTTSPLKRKPTTDAAARPARSILLSMLALLSELNCRTLRNPSVARASVAMTNMYVDRREECHHGLRTSTLLFPIVFRARSFRNRLECNYSGLPNGEMVVSAQRVTPLTEAFFAIGE